MKFFVFLVCVAAAWAAQNPEVQTSLGKIKGSVIKSRLGKDILSFRGVRYGKAPVGEMRFRPAEPVDSWPDTFDASQEGPACMQPGGENSSEDCLALNIYTTKLPSTSDSVKRPVIVFIHPGGFSGYSAQSNMWGPQYLLDQEVVLVTINYRLAALGFISTGTHHAPGNLGLKDQVTALRFVRDHIASFGGDPGSVTLMGMSAGARSVIFHMLSPMSRGLFHRAVAMSGTAIRLEKLRTEMSDFALKQARLVNCTTRDLDEMFKCLKNVPAQDIASTLSEFQDFHGDPVLLFHPVVEPKIPGVKRFLHAQPVNIIRSGKFNHVPLITGITKDEIIGTVFNALQSAKNDNSTSYYDDLNADWERVAPIIFQYNREGKKSRAASRAIKKFYFNNEPVSVKNGDKLIQAYGDANVGFPVNRSVTLMAQYNTKPVYYYEFVYQGRFGFETWTDTKKPYDVTHQDDLMYVFYISILFPYFNSTDPEIPMVEKMTSLWSNFARTGKPIPKNNKYFEGVTWKRVTPDNNNYLQINNTFEMKSNLNSDRYALWTKLFALPPYKEPKNKAAFFL